MWKVKRFERKLWAPGEPRFTKPYCGKQGSATTDPTIPNSWDSVDRKNNQHKAAAVINGQERKNHEEWRNE